jgi:hypothetical protein
MTFFLASVPGAIANTLAFCIVGRLTRSAVFGLAGTLLLLFVGVHASISISSG